MITVLTRSAIHWMEAHRRRARARARAAPEFEGALDAAYRDSARLRATYAVH